MAESDSFFDDDDFADSFASEPSEELLGESEGSFEDLGGLDSDTPDAGIPHEELIAKAQEDVAAEDVSTPESVSATAGASVATKPAKKKGRFSIYTVMLIMSFVFLTTAAILIFMELGRLK